LNLPLVREHDYASIKSGEYFGEIAFVAMCKKMLEVRDSVCEVMFLLRELGMGIRCNADFSTKQTSGQP